MATIAKTSTVICDVKQLRVSDADSALSKEIRIVGAMSMIIVIIVISTIQLHYMENNNATISTPKLTN